MRWWSLVWLLVCAPAAAEDANEALRRGLLSCNSVQVTKALEAGADPNLKINRKAGAWRCLYDHPVLEPLFAYGLRSEGIIANDFQNLANGDWPVRTLRLLLRHGLDVNTPNAAGFTLMHYWAQRKNGYQLLEEALARGGDPNGGGTNELSPLHQAVRSGRAANAALLLAHGARLDHPRRFFDYPGRNYGAIGVLLAAGLDPNVDLGGRTPLHWAVSKGDVAMVRLLLQWGADPQQPDGQGQTPLELAVTRGDVELFPLLKGGVQ